MKSNCLVILDALRGLAGIAVVLLHFGEAFEAKRLGTDVRVPVWCGHGYLAVEFFMLLMGYMLAFAYDRRWTQGMTLKDFCLRRLQRLHPLVIPGTVLGLLVAFYDPTVGYSCFAGLDKASKPTLALCALWAVTMVPVVGFKFLNPFNPCTWTLYYEYLGNFLYGAFVRRFGKRVLAVAATLSFVLLALMVYRVNLADLLGVECDFLTRLATKQHHCSLVGGTILTDVEIYRGFMRLLFPFFFGLLLARLGWKLTMPRFGLPVAVVVFLAVLFTPHPYSLGAPDHPWINGTFELAAVGLVFPALLLLGAGSATGGRTDRFWTFLGELSYPLYMTHWPFYYLFWHWVYRYSSRHSGLFNLFVSVVVILLIGLVSWCVGRYWDRPVGNWIGSRWRKR